MNTVIAGSNHIGQIVGFHPEEKDQVSSRQCLQQGSVNRHCQVQLVKARPRVFTPKLKTGYSKSTTIDEVPCVAATNLPEKKSCCNVPISTGIADQSEHHTSGIC